ncbi:DUF6790 family protein [Methanothermobacter wolfeii]|uniref:DUF6790 family protein n=1 Tax=Methanothermobacter wolfeii TaxID=145261 RepID=UPI003BF5F74E
MGVINGDHVLFDRFNSHRDFYLSYTNRKDLDRKRFVEIVLLPLLVFQVGFGSLWNFIGHALMPDMIASYIGWPSVAHSSWRLHLQTSPLLSLGFYAGNLGTNSG